MKNPILIAAFVFGTALAHIGAASATETNPCWTDRNCRVDLIIDYRDASYTSSSLPSGVLVYGGKDNRTDSALMYTNHNNFTGYVRDQKHGRVEMKVDFANRAAEFEAYAEGDLSILATSEMGDQRFDAASGYIVGSARTSDGKIIWVDARLRNSGKDAISGGFGGAINGRFFARKTGEEDSSTLSFTRDLPSGKYSYIGRLTEVQGLPEVVDKTRWNGVLATVDFGNNKVERIEGYKYVVREHWGHFANFEADNLALDAAAGTFAGTGTGLHTKIRTETNGMATVPVNLSGEFNHNGYVMTGAVTGIGAANSEFNVKYQAGMSGCLSSCTEPSEPIELPLDLGSN